MREAILEQIEISDVIGSGGKNKIPCPFPDHHDKDPSLVIYPDSFYCFGCKRGGTVIDFVMYRDGVTAGEAMKFLCQRYNIPLREWTPEEKKRWEKEKREKDVVFQILSEATEYYHSCLTPERREYYHKRGLTDETIDKLKLGYADGKLAHAFQDEIDERVGKHNDAGLLLSGLFARFDDGVIHDSFERRYMLPYWKSGKVVYFIGRLDTNDPKEIKKLPKWNCGKYKKLATYDKEKRPYVSQFIKNEYFYGEDSICENETGIITEGVIDCIHLLQAGYSSISPVTEEFRDADMPKLAKASKRWKTTYVANDNEESGIGEQGAIKTAQHLFEQGLDVRIVTLPRPEGVKKVDVADFLNVPPEQYPSKKRDFQALLDSSPEFIQFKIEKSQNLPDISRRGATKEIFALLASCSDQLQVDFYSFSMQSAGLIKNASMFNKGLKDAKIQLAKKRKEVHFKDVEKTDPMLHLKLQIEEVRKNDYKKAFEIKKEITTLILNDLRQRGKFYYTVSKQFFWFENETKTLNQIGDDSLEANIFAWYGINGSETEYEYLKSALKSECFNAGTLTEVQQFAFYNKERNKLYVYNNNGGIFRLNGRNVEMVDNGIDGVLFLKNQYWKPFEYKKGNQEFFKKLVVDPINFINGEFITLNNAEQSALFAYWIYSLFFESIQPTKPIMAIVGPKGSGKTTVLKIVGKTLLGENYNVSPLTQEDDFDAAISNNAFVFYDNVDSKADWLNDRLAHTATGKMIQKRELYTTNENVYFFPKCFIALNAREPKFKRDDVTDRLLLFRVDRLESFISESTIIDDILAHRNELMSELLNDLNDIVRMLAKDKEPFMSQHRMADWADLGWRISKISGQEEDFIHLLEKMDKEQSEFLLEEHPIFLCLDEWMLIPENHNREVNASTLYNEFQLLAKEKNLTFPYDNTIGLAVNLRNILSNIKEFWKVRDEKKRKGWIYTFSSLEANGDALSVEEVERNNPPF